jgi:nicotinamidase-related amidase
MVAVDVQNYFRPSAGMVSQINQMAVEMPTVATIFKHREDVVPLVKFGRQPPRDVQVLVNTTHIFDKFGFVLPDGLLTWLKNQNPEEVLITGGMTDANVLAAGFSVFQAGFRPCMVPVLCYGNDWYMHTVTAKIWEVEIGKVYQSVAELRFG